MTTRDSVRAFITEHLRPTNLRDDVDIFESGLAGSMFVMQLVLFVEQEFGIAVTGDDLNFDSFRTVDAVSALVDRKRLV